MKCPKCGKEIANDSFFCEYCGTQIKPIKKVRKAPWVVMTIVFGVLTLGLCGLAYYEIKAAKIAQSEAQEKIHQLQDTLKDGDSRFNAIKWEKQEAEEKLKIWTNYTSQIPFVITDVQIANGDYNRNIITNYGSIIYSSSTMYLMPKIKYYGMSAGTKNIKVKLYRPDGTMCTGNSSPAGCTYKEDKYFYTGHNEASFIGWGGSPKGFWKAGKYRFEFWYNNTCLGQKTFIIY